MASTIGGLLQFLLVFSVVSLASGVGNFPLDGGKFDSGLIVLRRSAAETAGNPPPDAGPLPNTSFVLAAERTRRKDPLDGFKRYTGGWNISEQHYWASVAFTAVPFFLIAAIWFVLFGLTLLLACCCYCCCPRRSYSYSRAAYACSLVFLVLFTISVLVGSFFLYYGQGKFHSSTSKTLDYIVSQSNYTVENLRNFSSNLADAKKVKVENLFLPVDVQGRIDEVQTKLNTSANDLAVRTSDNERKIQNLLDRVRLILIIIAAAMLLLAFLGFFLSILGLQFLVSILMLIGWVLVVGTFILTGVFLLLHNVVADTCVAMDEWVQNPHAHTALDDILPCVDTATANESLYRSKEVTFQLANVINNVIANVSNKNFSPVFAPLYYNQSGPLAPLLCNPFTSDMKDGQCASGEVDFNNASQVWRGYICSASGPPGSEVCNSVGRFTPDVYGQLAAATNVSFGLYHYGPFLTQLEDCTFVRDTFMTISNKDCPGLSRYSKYVCAGLALVSAAVMLSLILWVIYARERRHRAYSKEYVSGSSRPLQDKGA